MVGQVLQTVTPPNKFLYREEGGGQRRVYFEQSVIRAADSEPLLECTQEERDEWDAAHT